jgi:hypothetical protein
MNPNQLAITVLVASTLLPFTLIFIKLDELLIWIGLFIVCAYVKSASTF